MKVLMLSGDPRLLHAGSAAARRLELQRSQVEILDVLVWPQKHSLSRVLQTARREHYDIITAQDPFWRGLVAWVLARMTGAKLNVQVHTDLSAEPLIRHVLGQIILRHADSIRVVSQRLKAQLTHAHIRVPILVLPVYVNEKYQHIIRRPHAGKNILWIGRFEKEKNPFLAIHIFQEIYAHLPDTKLVMVGGGSLQTFLERAVVANPSIEMHGWKDDMTPYFEVADVTLCTSLSESYGASMVEALAAGVPVVAPDVGVAREAGAIVVERSDLAKAVIEVLHTEPVTTLKIPLLSKEQWALRWKETLL